MSDESPEWLESFASWIDELEVVDPHFRSFDVATGLLGGYAYAAKSAVDLPGSLLSVPQVPANAVTHPPLLSHSGYNDDSSDSYSDADMFIISRRQSWATATSPTSPFGYIPASSMSSSIHHQQPHHEYHQQGQYCSNNSLVPQHMDAWPLSLVDSATSTQGLSYSTAHGGAAQSCLQLKNLQQPMAANHVGTDFELPAQPQHILNTGVPPFLRTLSPPHTRGTSNHGIYTGGVRSPVSLSAANSGTSPVTNSSTTTAPGAPVSSSATTSTLEMANNTNGSLYPYEVIRPSLESNG
ncbi:hypothetical protein HDU83_004552 [Entophlyctis luteolus]|nr:hypothetical protein HDU83_004552 [Entophlyctis luteolus]